MKISEASQASGCHLETVRYYERVGLVPSPNRTGSGYRVYAQADVERLRFVTRGRELGFSLEEIRSLLRLDDDPTMSCRDVDAMARTQRVHGDGVVGEQPVLEPGESFEYTSGTPLSTPSGFMRGLYHMIETASGEAFDVVIPAFSLDSPHQAGAVH